jgi:peptidoglycan/LPS O-acetylase OafA/YrhL
VRGIAWAIVFCSHAFTLPLAIGQEGMFVFFALSGFLITGLLIEERVKTGGVSLRRFFARRALRLLPALGFFLVTWLAIVLVTRGAAPWTTTVPGGGSGPGTAAGAALQGVGAAVVYLTNWAQIGGWFTSYVPLGHLWSLAVEEQFYLIWSPVVAFIVCRRSRAAVEWATGLAAAASFVDVAVRDGHGLSLVIDMSTDTRAGAFLVGSALAAAWTRRARWLKLGQAVGSRTLVAAALLILGWGAWAFDHQVPQPAFTATWVGVSLAAGLLVVAFLDDRGSPHGVAESSLATYVGRRSYGLYLWHYVWLTWLAGLGSLGIPMALAATFTTAEASWRLVERPALARKARFTTVEAPGETLHSPQMSAYTVDAIAEREPATAELVYAALSPSASSASWQSHEQ